MPLNQLSTFCTRVRRAVRVLPFVLTPTILPAIARADCVPTVPKGYLVEFVMSAHSDTNIVSYTRGFLSPSESSGFTTQLSGAGTALYSDRRYPQYELDYPGGWPPFDFRQPDKITLSISSSISRTTFSPAIGVTITNNTWGGLKNYFSGQCDATTNLLYGSTGNALVVISFGLPYNPNPK